MARRSHAFRNAGGLDRLERSVLRGDVGSLPALVEECLEAGDHGPAVRGILASGWEAANPLVASMDLDWRRDGLVLALGHELVARGWAPDMPLRHESYRGERPHVHGPGLSIVRIYGDPALVRVEGPAKFTGPFGRAGTWQFTARYGIRLPCTLRGDGIPVSEPPSNQGATFRLEVIPRGTLHRADQFARDVIMKDRAALRRVAPVGWFLSRWSGSDATTMPEALGGTGVWAGFRTRPDDLVYFYEKSEGTARYMRPEEHEPAARQASRTVFLDSSRSGLVHGDEPPPAGTPAGVVRAWVTDPSRLEAIRALFYGDLFLAGLLIPPERLLYDPETLGPRAHGGHS